jgi:hypothetical protein
LTVNLTNGKWKMKGQGIPRTQFPDNGDVEKISSPFFDIM